MDDSAVFKALADPTRRLILDQLNERNGQSLTDLEAAVASRTDMTRFGVMKHVKVLVAAALITTRREGRVTRHFLNRVPIRLIHDRWITKYVEPNVAALSDLKHHLESSMTNTQARSDTLVFQIYIRATPERVWEAITSSEFRRQYFFGSTAESDYRTGSRLRSYSPEGEQWGDDLILESDPPRLLSHEWRSLYDPELAAEPASRVTWTVEPSNDGVTKLTVVHDRLGDSPKTAASVSGGWMFIISGLKTVVETGSPLGGA